MTRAHPRFGWLNELPARIAIGAVTIAISVGVALTAVATVNESRIAEANLRMMGERAAANLAHNSVVGVLAGDRAQVRRVARALLDMPDVVRVVVTSRGPEPFVVVERPGKQPKATLSFAAPVTLEPSTDVEELYANPAEAKVIGTAEIVLSRDRSYAARRHIILLNGMLLLGAIAMAVVASVLLAHRIARPIERLSAAAEAVGAGRLDVSLPVESADVIGRLSAAFNKMVEDLRKLEEGKNNFIALTSHELRTPLVALKGYLQLANTGGLGVVPDTLRAPLHAMERNVNRLTQHVEVLLLFSGLQMGQLTLVCAPVRVDACLLGAVEELRPRAAEHHLIIDVAIENQPLIVMGDGVRLTLVFDSLLSNAVKFSPEPGRIRVRAFTRDRFVVVEVIDQGMGIPAELRDKIFDRFFQVQAPITRRHAGVGLGLSLAKDLVALHGGRVEVESEVGKGSTFRVMLPLEPKA
jgi:signal transduction histidine kinase